MAVRWLITGSGGQLGRSLEERLSSDPDVGLVAALDHSELDIADPDALATVFGGLPGGAPDVLVNAAAMTAVDRCESERDLAFRVNAEAPGRLADLCAEEGVRMVHVSTDYVFDGRGPHPYREDDATGPETVYGASKLEGERRVRGASQEFLLVRTSWVFGPGKNFVKAILRQAQLRRSGEVTGPLRVVDDQLGCPTYAADLADGIQALVESGARGIVHLSNAEPATWWDFARAILDATGHGHLEIERIATADIDLPAPRPRYSVLSCERAAGLGVRLRPWREALVAYLDSPDAVAALEGA